MYRPVYCECDCRTDEQYAHAEGDNKNYHRTEPNNFQRTMFQRTMLQQTMLPDSHFSTSNATCGSLAFAARASLALSLPFIPIARDMPNRLLPLKICKSMLNEDLRTSEISLRSRRASTWQEIL